MSASLMIPPTVEKLRVRPDISLAPPVNGAAFSAVFATVIKLTPSPRVPGALMDCKSDVVTMKRRFAAAAQRVNALRVAPTTSLPDLMLVCGDDNEEESAIVIVLPGHLT